MHYGARRGRARDRQQPSPRFNVPSFARHDGGPAAREVNSSRASLPPELCPGTRPRRSSLHPLAQSSPQPACATTTTTSCPGLTLQPVVLVCPITSQSAQEQCSVHKTPAPWLRSARSCSTLSTGCRILFSTRLEMIPWICLRLYVGCTPIRQSFLSKCPWLRRGTTSTPTSHVSRPNSP